MKTHEYIAEISIAATVSTSTVTEEGGHLTAEKKSKQRELEIRLVAKRGNSGMIAGL